MPRILVIDDDRSVVHLIREAMKGTDVEIHGAETAADGLTRIASERPDVVLLDVVLADSTGLDVFRRVRELDARLPVVLITSHAGSDIAISAMKYGAYDLILKPLDVERLRQKINQALEPQQQVHVPAVRPGLPRAATDLIIGRSPEMLEVYKAIGRVASQDVTVLITGESGTGKELIARAIYQHSARADKPFLAVNCAALAETLLESELFGHERGAFTGADRRRVGKFEQCHGGTIFLDEVGDMSPAMQAKMLRVLQEHRFERVGGTETIQTDVRVIAATNRNLEAMVAAGTYRSDLYYRLNGYSIHLPALRDRGEDLLELIEYYFSHFTAQMDRHFEGISPQAVRLLLAYSWPGNVRELQHTMRKILLQATGPVITPDDLPKNLLADTKSSGLAPANNSQQLDLKAFIDEELHGDATDLYARSLALVERFLITQVLRITHGNQSKASRILGITRASLRFKLRSLGLTVNQVIQADQAVAEPLPEELSAPPLDEPGSENGSAGA